MPTDNPSLGLEDFKINVRLKLAAIWTSVTLCYLYCDYFELYQPGKLQSMLGGQMGPLGPTTQGVLLVASVLLAIPALMIVLSLLLSPRLSRILNLAFGVLFTLIMLVIVPREWFFYQFFGAVEIIMSCAVVWYAWKWPRAAQASTERAA